MQLGLSRVTASVKRIQGVWANAIKVITEGQRHRDEVARHRDGQFRGRLTTRHRAGGFGRRDLGTVCSGSFTRADGCKQISRG